MARTVKSSGRERSSEGQTKRSTRHRSPTKEFNPSPEVRIVPRASDGSETWEVVIAPSAMRKLAKYAGVTEADLDWLREPLEFMMFNLQCDKSSAPSWPKRIEHHRATARAARKLEILLQPPWVAAAIRHFKDRKLKQQIFGTRGLVAVKTRADGQKVKEWMRAGSHLEGVTRDMEAVTRMCDCISSMIDQLERAVAEGRRAQLNGASNPTKQYIADYAVRWWMHLGHGAQRTKTFVNFARILYQLAGFSSMSDPAIREQLTSAVKRRDARADEQ